MILKFKYHSDNGMLEAYQSYILAQNSSLVDSVLITSTADDAQKYDYCLEFVCYNSKNIPKAQYISPILKYNDGITFTLPNNLTEYKGHVDMQLTGYDPEDNSIVFKSIGKNCKAFDVEGSLNVLESDLGETPNVLTEVMQELELLKNIRQEIITEATEKLPEVCEEYFKGKEYCRVRFYRFNDLLKETYVPVGTTCSCPENVVIPYYCETDGKWYDSEELIEYTPELAITRNHDFIYNFWTKGITTQQGLVTGYEPDEQSNISDFYIPEVQNGVRITGFKAPDGEDSRITFKQDSDVYIPSGLTEGATTCYLIKNVHAYNVQCTNKLLNTDEFDVLYGFNYQVLINVPNTRNMTEYYIKPTVLSMLPYAVHNTTLKSIYLPESLQQISEYSVSNNRNLTYLNIPKFVNTLADNAVYYNEKLTELNLEGDISALITAEKFKYSGEFKLKCPIEYLINYSKALGTISIDYEMKGKDALDILYVSRFEQ